MYYRKSSIRKSRPSAEALATSRKIVEQEREFNGGMSNFERHKEGIKAAKMALMAEVAEIMQPVIDYVKTKYGEWHYTAIGLGLTCGRIPSGADNARVCDEWVEHEIKRHPSPEEGYREELQEAYLEMWLQSKRMIEEYSNWYYGLPPVKKQLAERDTVEFWKSMKPFKITGGYR